MDGGATGGGEAIGPNPWRLPWLIWGSLRKRAETRQGLPFAEWAEFAPTILEACGLNRQLMLPQLAALVTSDTGRWTSGDNPKKVFEFNGPLAKALFGSDADVLRLFVDPVDVEADARGMVEAVRAAALTWQGEPRAQGEEGG